ncbi:LytR/AlgR family response regulator transcription factor [Adhaeribacter terreus]|uniref:LytR/AlgR family response regulator transcription factor n=1 Tax=Adhaeribacter terreus TaxID=529703 RepID=A0ABW0E8V6_9BACT
MILKSVAIDDSPYALDIIKLYAEKIPELKLVQTFDDAIAGAEFLKEHPVDILFLDINMPDISGLQLVRALKVKPLVIFTTAYKDYAFEGFELEALDYLLKPIAFERFAKAVQKAVDLYARRQPVKPEDDHYFFVYSEYQAIKINAAEIEYIESLKNYLKIHLVDNSTVLTVMSLKKIVEKLPEGKFLRIHRSYVVPLAKVKSVLNRKVMLTTGKVFPVGDSYFQQVQDWKKS